MRPLTLCMAYYENPSMLRRHYALIGELVPEIKAALNLIVVDDGSPQFPARPPDHPLGIPVTILRMGVDIRWNQDACRNLAVSEAGTDWVLLTDIDHLTPGMLLHKAMTARLDPGRAYDFNRVSEPELKPYKKHPNSWLLTRDLYLKAGGYDERYAGIYGTDGMFRTRLSAVAKIGRIKEALIRVPRSVTPDASTTTYKRKQPDDIEGKARVRAEIAQSGDREPRRLTFPWERVHG